MWAGFVQLFAGYKFLQDLVAAVYEPNPSLSTLTLETDAQIIFLVSDIKTSNPFDIMKASNSSNDQVPLCTVKSTGSQERSGKT